MGYGRLDNYHDYWNIFVINTHFIFPCVSSVFKGDTNDNEESEGILMEIYNPTCMW